MEIMLKDGVDQLKRPKLIHRTRVFASTAAGIAQTLTQTLQQLIRYIHESVFSGRELAGRACSASVTALTSCRALTHGFADETLGLPLRLQVPINHPKGPRT